ncbi:hypothetical protein CFOL_v3_33538 [Cephalotus follicularis]|uniref:[Phosphatase 2A protein]-leucine-carboxy methyltransferase 1 n=1 Tax=Cephalotus follicularis TaxID=3775 RepID=A0A1Q3DCI3_CEPFO|nr:hypothetical protein CFOL_v3_33538 [Cephalotus follicularis]
MPTFIIAECVLIYLDPDSSRAIVGWASKKFATAIFFLYEQIYPYDAFGEQMIKNLEVGKSYIYILMSRLNSPDVFTFLHRVEDVDSWVSMLHRLYRRRKIYFFTRDGRCTSLIRGFAFSWDVIITGDDTTGLQAFSLGRTSIL